jgi:hypothetical protein
LGGAKPAANNCSRERAKHRLRFAENMGRLTIEANRRCLSGATGRTMTRRGSVRVEREVRQSHGLKTDKRWLLRNRWVGKNEKVGQGQSWNACEAREWKKCRRAKRGFGSDA